MRQLRNRVFKLREDADNIYHLARTEGTPTINWGNMMEEKLVRASCISPGHAGVVHSVPASPEAQGLGGLLGLPVNTPVLNRLFAQIEVISSQDSQYYHGVLAS